MKMKKFLTFCFLLIAVSGFAQKYQRYLVDTLASPYFDGRGYVNNGVQNAADFIANQFDSLGLTQPINQTFPIQVNVFPGNLNLKINGVDLIPGKDYLVDPISGGGTAKVEAAYINVFSKSQMKKLMNSKKYISNILAFKSRIP